MYMYRSLLLLLVIMTGLMPLSHVKAEMSLFISPERHDHLGMIFKIMGQRKTVCENTEDKQIHICSFEYTALTTKVARIRTLSNAKHKLYEQDKFVEAEVLQAEINSILAEIAFQINTLPEKYPPRTE